MYQYQKDNLKKDLKKDGYTYKPSTNSYDKGNNKISFDSPNGFNSSGTTYRGYDNCKNHLNKKK